MIAKQLNVAIRRCFEDVGSAGNTSGSTSLRNVSWKTGGGGWGIAWGEQGSKESTRGGVSVRESAAKA
jgi:hypothetical protein